MDNVVEEYFGGPECLTDKSALACLPGYDGLREGDQNDMWNRLLQYCIETNFK